jgi:hypothetical protein
MSAMAVRPPDLGCGVWFECVGIQRDHGRASSSGIETGARSASPDLLGRSAICRRAGSRWDCSDRTNPFRKVPHGLLRWGNLGDGRLHLGDLALRRWPHRLDSQCHPRWDRYRNLALHCIRIGDWIDGRARNTIRIRTFRRGFDCIRGVYTHGILYGTFSMSTRKDDAYRQRQQFQRHALQTPDQKNMVNPEERLNSRFRKKIRS